jgi:hypothetical protein
MNSLNPIISPKRILIFVCLVFIVATCAFRALAAEASQLVSGEGGEELSGFYVGDQSYVLKPENPWVIDSVEFSIDGSVEAGFVSIRLEENGIWYRCELSGDGNQLHASCDTTHGGSPNIAHVTSLRVVAAAK